MYCNTIIIQIAIILTHNFHSIHDEYNNADMLWSVNNFGIYLTMNYYETENCSSDSEIVSTNFCTADHLNDFDFFLCLVTWNATSFVSSVLYIYLTNGNDGFVSTYSTGGSISPLYTTLFFSIKEKSLHSVLPPSGAARSPTTSLLCHFSTSLQVNWLAMTL